MPADAQPLSGTLVVELAWYLPIAYAGRELARLGARVVRVEAPEGDPLRRAAPAWDSALRGGKESVVCDLKADAAFARDLCARADVVLEGLRPGVAARLGVGPDDLPASVVHCSITGFGPEGRHAQRAGHDLNYLGWAGALEDTPSCPPLQIADLAAGALGAVTEVLAALVRRAQHGRRCAAVRLDDAPQPRPRRAPARRRPPREDADGRPRLLRRVRDRGRPPPHRRRPRAESSSAACVSSSDGRSSQSGSTATPRRSSAASWRTAFAARSLADWLARFDGEDVCVGPVATRLEAAVDFGDHSPESPTTSNSGTTRAAWRAELGRARDGLSGEGGEPESGRKGAQVGDPVGLVREPLVAVEQDRAHAERAGAFDVVLVGVADHDRLGRGDPEGRQRALEDRGVRLRAAVALRAHRDVDVEAMVAGELLEVALPVRDRGRFASPCPRRASRTGTASS